MSRVSLDKAERGWFRTKCPQSEWQLRHTVLFSDRCELLWVSYVHPRLRHLTVVGSSLFSWYNDDPETRAKIEREVAACYVTGQPRQLVYRVASGNVEILAEVCFERVANLIACSWRLVIGDGLTGREREILLLICDELTAAEIAAKLGISSSTYEYYRAALLKKTGAVSTAGLVRWAIRYGLIEP